MGSLFSCTFQFIDNDNKYEIYPYIKEGVTSIKKFLTAMYKDLEPKDELTNNLYSKVIDYPFDKIPKDMFFVQDYVYHIKDDSFERGSVLNLTITDKKVPFKKLKNVLKGKNYWDFFVRSHIVVYKKQNKKIMPTFVLVYKDNSIRMKSYQYSLRTTMYRIINNIADEIRKDYIKCVLIVCESYSYPGFSDSNISELFNMPYQERIEKMNPVTNLTFYKILEDGTITVLLFDSSKVEDVDYVADTMHNSKNTTRENSFLKPILKAFIEKSDDDLKQ